MAQLTGFDTAGVNNSGIITPAPTMLTILKASRGPSFVSAPSGGSRNTGSVRARTARTRSRPS